MSRWMPLWLVACTTVDTDTGDLVCSSESVGPVTIDLDAPGRTALFESDAGYVLVAESGDQLAVFESSDATTWTPREVPFVQAAIVTRPSVVIVDGEAWLYYVTASSASGTLELWRTRFDAGAFGGNLRVDLPEPVRGLDSAPTFFGDGGAVWAAWREQGRPQASVSVIGAFVEVEPPTNDLVDSFAITSFSDGSVVALWETGDDPVQAVMSRTTSGGADWSPPFVATSLVADARDVAALTSGAGRVDLYYAVDSGGGTIARRAVFANTPPGPQEPLAFGVSDPVAHRLSDCRVLVTAAGRGETDGPVLVTSVLPTDAPAPDGG